MEENGDKPHEQRGNNTSQTIIGCVCCCLCPACLNSPDKKTYKEPEMWQQSSSNSMNANSVSADLKSAQKRNPLFPARTNVDDKFYGEFRAGENLRQVQQTYSHCPATSATTTPLVQTIAAKYEQLEISPLSNTNLNPSAGPARYANIDAARYESNITRDDGVKIGYHTGEVPISTYDSSGYRDNKTTAVLQSLTSSDKDIRPSVIGLQIDNVPNIQRDDCDSQNMLSLSPMAALAEARTIVARRKPFAVPPSPPSRTLMLEIVGVRVGVVKETPCLRSSLHSAAVCIVWTPDSKIFQWNGKDSPSVLRVKGLQLCSSFKEAEHGSRAEIIRVEEGEECEEFWARLGNPNMPAIFVQRDMASEEELFIRNTVLLEFCHEDSNNGSRIGTGHLLKRGMLRSHCAYVLKAPARKMYLWIGSSSSEATYRAAIEFAKRDVSLAVKERWITAEPTIESDSGESTLFRTLFSDWVTSCGTQVQKFDKPKSPTITDSSTLAKRAGATTVAQGDNRQACAENTLYHVKGRKLVTVVQVPLTPQAMNSNDVFVLATKKTIFQWNGQGSNPMEKSKAADFAAFLKEKQYCGRVRTVVLEQSNSSSHDSEEFWQSIGNHSNLGSETESDDKHEEDARNSITLVAIGPPNSQAPGFQSVQSLELSVSEMRRPYKVQSFSDEGAYVLAWPGKQLFVWTSVRASPETKQRAWNYAAHLQGTWCQGREPWRTPIEHVTQHGESPLFCAHLQGYSSQATPSSAKPSSSKLQIRTHADVCNLPPDKCVSPPGKDKSTIILESRAALVDIDEMEASPPLVEELITPAIKHDDGSTGRLRLWRIVQGKLSESAAVSKPLLLSGLECYILLYTYCPGVDFKVNRHIIYAWQGQFAKKQDIALSAMNMGEVANQIKGQGMSDRQTIPEGKETDHFLVVAGGVLISSLLSTANEEQIVSGRSVRLFDLRSSASGRGKAVEVNTRAAALFSGGCFIMILGPSAQTANGPRSVIWKGQCSSEPDLALAISATARIQGGRKEQQSMVLQEGSEPPWFWDALGGRGAYGRVERCASLGAHLNGLPLRVFYLEMAGELVRPREIAAPCPEDLSNSPAGACLVDHLFSGTVYVWHDGRCVARHLRECIETARRYIQARNRRLGAPAVPPDPVVETEGRESNGFTACFHAWGRFAA